ncbi:MAG: hypothetical protein PHP62_03730 [Candidatus Moranbacteria bacterium]|nr:hypothetical protein [Candidatus Moranbacteria bacterium]
MSKQDSETASKREEINALWELLKKKPPCENAEAPSQIKLSEFDSTGIKFD